MRKMYLLLLATMLSSALVAQNNVVNGNFENWEDSLNYSEPVNWNTNNFETRVIGIPVLRTTDAQSGTYAAIVRTVYEPNTAQYYGGFLTNGDNRPDSLGYNGWQINYRPQKLSGYYKYTTGTSLDRARVVLYMYKHDNVADTVALVATGTIRLAPVNDYTYFEFPVLNAFPGSSVPIPDSYVILITSTDTLGSPARDTSKLYIDNLNFISPTAAPTLIDAADINIYPNPVEDYFVINSPKHEVVSAAILSAEGRQVQYIEGVAGGNDLLVNTSRLSKGFYYVQIRFENGAVETRFITVVK
ncbi:hypothetical protein BH09BAC1_BH09BAC1_09620 [soil metagenome]